MELFVAGFLLSLSLCFDLGIVNLAMVRAGLQSGGIAAFLIGLGSCFGDLLYAVASLFAVSLLLEHAIVRWTLWIGGTAALLFLAWRMLRESFGRNRAATEILDGPAFSHAAGAAHFRMGFVLALASPSAILWFAAVGGSLIAAYADAGNALLPFFAGFFAAGLLWSLGIALLAGQAGRALGPRLTRILALLSALLFLYFAFRVFGDGYESLIARS